MDMHRLTVFTTVAQYMSFTSAAKHLHIAQSAVSRDIAELEKELGTKLFDRTKVGISLTTSGQIFLEDACKILNIAQSSKQRIQTLSAGAKGDLIIGFISEQMIEPLVPLFKIFTEKHPSINIHFNSYTSISLARKIENNELDIAFGRYESLVRNDEINWKHLYKDPFYVAMPASHKLADAGKLTMDDIANETIIIMSRESNPGFFDLIQNLYLSRGLPLLVNSNSNDRMSTIMMCEIGMGLALMTKQFFKIYNFDNIKILPLDEEDAFHNVGIAWNKKTSNPAAKLYLEELEKYIETLPDKCIKI